MSPTPSRRRRGRGRRFTTGDGPNPVDVHVGERIRLMRTLRGLSQAALGDALGVSFQQVQKYEKGANRTSASVLHRLSQVLGVPVGVFFDAMEDEAPPSLPGAPSNREAVELLNAYHHLPATLRHLLRDLVRGMAGQMDGG